jgi:hypothetical protein
MVVATTSLLTKQQPTVAVAVEVLRSNGFIFRASYVRKETIA